MFHPAYSLAPLTHRDVNTRDIDYPASSELCGTEGKQPVMNDGSIVNEKSSGKHKALNAQPYWLLTGANNISIALTETNHTFLPATTQVLACNKFFPLIKQ